MCVLRRGVPIKKKIVRGVSIIMIIRYSHFSAVPVAVGMVAKAYSHLILNEIFKLKR